MIKRSSGNLAKLITALVLVYIIWGSTYLAIKFAIETMPSFLMAGTRFVVAGSFIYLLSFFSKGYTRPRVSHWRSSLILGFLLLGVGNGAVVVGQHYISSSLTALLLATIPLWMVMIGWAFMGTGRPGTRAALGLGMGFFGVALLVMGQNGNGSGDGYSGVYGIGFMMAAAIGWSVGSLYGANAPTVPSTLQGAGMQMLCGGALMLLFGTITGEWATFDIAAISFNSWLALGYLIVFGAVVAFTAYSWLMTNTTPAIMSTYAYVNPMIAVLLGWLIAGEEMNAVMLAGTAIVVGSVVLITSNKGRADTGESDEDVHFSQMPGDNAQCLAKA